MIDRLCIVGVGLIAGQLRTRNRVAALELLAATLRGLESFRDQHLATEWKTALLDLKSYLEGGTSLEDLKKHPQLDEILSGMMFSGILERRLGVRFVMGEAGLGWIPYAIERFEHEFDNYADAIGDHKLEMRPSEIFARQVFVAARGDERTLPSVVELVGDDNIVFNTDYPHPDGTFPWGLERFEEQPLSEESRRKILWDNPVRLYGLGV